MRSILKILLITIISVQSIAAQNNCTISSAIEIDGSETYNYDLVTITTGGSITIKHGGFLTVTNNLTNSNGLITIENGGILTVSGTLTNTDATKLIIEEGGQLRNRSNDVAATLYKTIGAYGSGQWYLISLPVDIKMKESPFVVNNGIAGTDFDLYYYKEEDALWYSYKDHPTNTVFNKKKGYGYLYANSTEKKYQVTGNLIQEDLAVKLTTDCGNVNLRGFTLLGNPYPHDIYKGKVGGTQTAIGSGDLQSGYYVLNGNSSFISCGFNIAIRPFQGILVKATTEQKNKTIENTWNPAEDDKSRDEYKKDISVVLDVAGVSGYDRSYIYFFEGDGLDKIDHLADTVPSLCVSYNDNHYAIAHIAEECHNLDVLFKSNQQDFFTITVKPENGGFKYLHLIDNITGDDIDLLVEPSYKFASSGNDYESRFKLVMYKNNDGCEEHDNFAYISNDDIIITGVEGCATLQVFDVMGRLVNSEIVSGTSGSICRVNKPNSAGVYVLRLIENNNVNAQRIVVE